MNEPKEAVFEYNVHVYKKNNLIYIATLKCGSTYFVSLLLVNGWNRIYFKDIDWSKHYVVAFIRDSKERYISGVIEDLYQTQTIEEPKPDAAEEIYANLKNLLTKYSRDFFLMSYHSLPITYSLADYVDQIHWIPVATNFDHQKEFFDICARFDCPISVTESKNIDYNYSDLYKKQYQKDFASIQPENSLMFKIHFSGNQMVYNRAKTKYNLI
jgi:hypothetical protein